MKIRAILIVLAAALLVGCGAGSKAAPTALPTVMLGGGPLAASPGAEALAGSGQGGVRAAGFVVPIQQAEMASLTGGNVRAVYVSLGEQVKAGQVLMRLAGEERLAAGVEAANLELLSAQQALRAFNDNAGQAAAAAQVRLANAEKALEEAQQRRAWKEYRNGSQTTIEAARADMFVAKDALEKAEEYYNAFADRAEADLSRAQALSALSNARKAYDRAVANVNYLLAMPNEIAVDQAEAERMAAQAERESAQQAVERLKDGVDGDALALAEARVSNARAQLKASQTALDDLELKAPFEGTVSRIYVQAGEWAVPGQVVLVLADLSALRVETTDLSERDVPRVKRGQPVAVLISALGLEIAGTVRDISPQADTLGGDVVYQTIIDLAERPEDLYAGMSVEVSFGAR